MRLSDLTTVETVGRKYRRKVWGWEDGPSRYGGYCYVNSIGQVRFISRKTTEYTYGFGLASDWYEVDDREYPVPLKVIVVGGE